MRMWMIPTKYLCKKHLLGEHGEIHKHRHNFVKKHSISGRISPIVQIEPSSMQVRHDELVKEMLNRGMNHKSPYKLPNLSHLTKNELSAKVDTNISFKDLSKRCEYCKKLIEELKNNEM